MDIEKLKTVIVDRGYDIKKLSDRLKISEKVLELKINGIRKFNIEEIIALVEILNIKNPREVFFTN